MPFRFGGDAVHVYLTINSGFNLLVFIGLGIFWMVKHQMPYDLI